MSYINFIADGLTESGKTAKWKVWTKDNIPLGRIKWYGSWRRYVYEPNMSTLYDASCLSEIAAFCKLETEKHKEKS